MDNLTTMMVEIQKHCSSSNLAEISLDRLKSDQPLIAQSAGDGRWCRALLVDVDHALHMARVQFVDYGTTETIPLSQVCCIPPQFLSLPKQAITCCLSGVQPLNKEEVEEEEKTKEEEVWNKEAIDAFKMILEEAEGKIKAKIVSIVEESSVEVSLSTDSCQDVAAKLILAGLASKCE